ALAGATAAQVDSVTIELHQASNFSIISDSYKAIIDTGGHVSGSMFVANIGQYYYIGMRHRNALFTCSADSIQLAAETSYNFKLSAASAFGANQYDLGDGFFAFYSGDVSLPSQDEYIGADDVGNVDNDNLAGLNYTNTDYIFMINDISGDGYIGADDVAITDNNNLIGAFSQH